MTGVVGLCGMGIMGSAVAARLHRGGVRVVTSVAGRSSATRGRVLASGAVPLESLADVASQADIVLSITGSAHAPSIAGDIATAVAASGRAIVVAECNLIAPDDMVELAGTLTAAGARVVDAGIVGPPPDDTRSPTFYASGPYAHQLDFLGEHGFVVRIVGPEIGQASALKVASAGVWQGALALIAETIVMAERHGQGAELLLDLERHQSAISGWFRPAIVEAVPRAARWSEDMAAISRTMAEAGASPEYHRSAGRLYASLAEVHETADPAAIIAALAAAATADRAS